MPTPATPSWLPADKGFDWGPLIEPVGRANRSISHFAGVLLGVPNPDVLLSPLTTHEAYLSARIEGTQTTFGEVLEFEAGKQPQYESRVPDIQEILNYRSALRRAEQELRTRPFNLNLLRNLHGDLLKSVRGERMKRGRFREEQNWIGAKDCKIEQADFVPPPHTVLPDHLSRWEEFYHAEGFDPLIQLAIIHAQFEFLHPFLDGNGRIGRLLIPLFLYERGVLKRPVFYMSEWLDENRSTYILSLRNLGDDSASWLTWVRFFLEGVHGQALRNSKKADQILSLYGRYKEKFMGEKSSRYSVLFLDSLFKIPVFTTSRLQFGRQRPSRPTVGRLIGLAEELGIIKVVRKGTGGIPAIYACHELVNLCEGTRVF